MKSHLSQRNRIPWAFALGASLFAAILCPILPAQDSPQIRVTEKPKGEAYVGQYVSIDVDVLTKEVIFGSPKTDLPEIEGGVLLQASTQAIRTPIAIDGKQVQQTRYSFAFFAHRAGTLEIPPIRFRFPAETGIKEPLESPLTKVEAVMPKGAENLSILVSTTDFEVKESWAPEPGEAKVGDAFVRTITMKAESVLGMGFPPLPIQKIDGIGTYFESPLVNDTSNRGDFSGERTETITYVCEREGEFEIPPITIPWFDLSAKELNRIELKGLRFSVAPNPALERPKDANGEAADPIDPKSNRWLIWLIVAALLGIAVVARRTWIQTVIYEWLRQRRESEPFVFRKLYRSARKGDAATTYQSLHTWTTALGENGGLPRITSATGSPELDAATEELSEFLFGNGSENRGTSWAGGPQLAKLLIRARNQQRHSERSASGNPNPDLEPLNP